MVTCKNPTLERTAGDSITKTNSFMKKKGSNRISPDSFSRLGLYDVVFSSSTMAVTTVGNRRFRVTLDLAIEQHLRIDGEVQGNWGAAIGSITDLVRSVGGRFMKRNGKKFVVLSTAEAKLKVEFALRQRLLTLPHRVRSSFTMDVSGLLVRAPHTSPRPLGCEVSAVIPPTVQPYGVNSSMDLPLLHDCESTECLEVVPSIADLSDDELSWDSDPVEWFPPTPVLINGFHHEYRLMHSE